MAELETATDTAGTGTVEIAAQGSRSPSSVGSGGIQLAPRTAGTTTVSGSIPGYITTSNASRTVTITAPGISASALLETGSGLQRFGSGGLLASNHPGVDVVIRSTNPAVALVAPDASTMGSDSIVIPIASGSTGFNFFAQGVEGQTGAAEFVITAAGFTPDTTAVTVAQPAFDLIGVNTSTTSFTSPDAFQVRLGIPNSDSSGIAAELVRNPGLSPLVATLTLTDSTVAELETATDTAGTATVEVAAEGSRSPSSVSAGGIQLAPRTAGTTTVSGTIPGFVATGNAVRTVTITAPGISATTNLPTGSGLQRFGSGGLLASDHPGVDVVIRSTNPAVALVAPDNATPGSDSIVIPIATGFTGFSFYAQGVDGQTGSADFVITAAGFTPDTTAVTVEQPAIDIIGLVSNTTTLSPNDPFQARIGIPSADSSGISAELTRNPDLPPLTVTFTSGTPAVGELVTQTFTGSSVTVEIAPQGSRSPNGLATETNDRELSAPGRGPTSRASVAAAARANGPSRPRRAAAPRRCGTGRLQALSRSARSRCARGDRSSGTRRTPSRCPRDRRNTRARETDARSARSSRGNPRCASGPAAPRRRRPRSRDG